MKARVPVMRAKSYNLVTLGQSQCEFPETIQSEVISSALSFPTALLNQDLGAQNHRELEPSQKLGGEANTVFIV